MAFLEYKEPVRKLTVERTEDRETGEIVFSLRVAHVLKFDRNDAVAQYVPNEYIAGAMANELRKLVNASQFEEVVIRDLVKMEHEAPLVKPNVCHVNQLVHDDMERAQDKMRSALDDYKVKALDKMENGDSERSGE